MFYALKTVWLHSDYLIVRNLRGEEIKIMKEDIMEISQNIPMVNPRLVKIIYEEQNGIRKYFRFIPPGGHWIFWHHPITQELEQWRTKNE